MDPKAKSKKKGGGASRRGSHRLSDGPGCEVRWYWQYHVGLEAAKSNYYMDFGTLVHAGLAYHYAERMAHRKPQWYLDQPSVDIQMEEDARGNPDWLRSSQALVAAYKRYYDADPWEPLYIEEEFEALVGDLDPDGEDEPAVEFEYTGPCRGYDELREDEPPCDHWTDEGAHMPHQTKRALRLPRLNEEFVTCRPDLLVRWNGFIYIIDHKTGGGDRKGTGRLPVINPAYPDYTYTWQAMVNLHVVRTGRCVDAPAEDPLEVAGFWFNRVKRDIPYDFARDPFEAPSRLYAKVPKTIRQCVKDERAKAIKCAQNPAALIAYPWECAAKWECGFTRLCHVNSVDERNDRIASEFVLR